MAKFKNPKDEQTFHVATETENTGEIDPSARLSDAARRALFGLWQEGLNSGPSNTSSFAALKVEARKRARL